MSLGTRVCHVSDAHKSNDGRIFKKECTSLAKAGYEVHFVVQGEDGVENGVQIHGLRTPGGRKDRMRSLRKEACEKALALDADLYHLHDPELLTEAKRFLAAGKKVVFDSHEYYTEQINLKAYIPSFLRKGAVWAYGNYERRVCSKIDAVVVPCPLDGVDYFGQFAKRECFIDNYPLIDTLLPFNSVPSDKVCCVGSLTHNRGITHLILAAHKAGFEVVLAGPINPQYMAKLQAMPEYECVDYRGVVPREEALGIMRECFCGSAAMLNVGQYKKANNYPTKLYEYYQCGIPAIQGKSAYNVKMAEQEPFFLLADPLDTDEYAAQLRRLHDDRDYAGTLVDYGQRLLDQKYNWEQESKKLVGLYEDILG